MDEFKFKDGSTVTVTLGEDGITVSAYAVNDKPMMGTYNDFPKMCRDIGSYFKRNCPHLAEEYWSKIPQQDKDFDKLAIYLWRVYKPISTKYTRIDIWCFLMGK